MPVLYGRLRVPGQPVGMELKGGTANYGLHTGNQIPDLQGSNQLQEWPAGIIGGPDIT